MARPTSAAITRPSEVRNMSHLRPHKRCASRGRSAKAPEEPPARDLSSAIDLILPARSAVKERGVESGAVGRQPPPTPIVSGGQSRSRIVISAEWPITKESSFPDPLAHPLADVIKVYRNCTGPMCLFYRTNAGGCPLGRNAPAWSGKFRPRTSALAPTALFPRTPSPQRRLWRDRRSSRPRRRGPEYRSGLPPTWSSGR